MFRPSLRTKTQTHQLVSNVPQLPSSLPGGQGPVVLPLGTQGPEGRTVTHFGGGQLCRHPEAENARVPDSLVPGHSRAKQVPLSAGSHFSLSHWSLRLCCDSGQQANTTAFSAVINLKDGMRNRNPVTPLLTPESVPRAPQWH